MRKLYDGYATPGNERVRYTLDWGCPTCKSENVKVDPEDSRKLEWCDGGPSTEDSLRYWVCADCGTRAFGGDMKTRRRKIKISQKELLDEQKASREFIEELSRLLERVSLTDKDV